LWVLLRLALRLPLPLPPLHFLQLYLQGFLLLIQEAFYFGYSYYNIKIENNKENIEKSINI